MGEHGTATRRSSDHVAPESTQTSTDSTADATTMTSHGPIPDVETSSSTPGPTASDRGFSPLQSGGPEIAPTPQALGAHVVEGMTQANNGPHSLTEGIHYWYNYQRACQTAGKPELWKNEYRMGHTQAPQFVQPHDAGEFMDFALKPNQSASQGIKAWLKGATIAECRSSVIALEVDALRAAIGDRKFDKLFGSADAKEDAAVPRDQRMHISTDHEQTPVANYIKATKVADDAQAQGGRFGEVPAAELDKDLIPGQWYYFYNHPLYLVKHPGGAWQGENALYMGKNPAGERVWSGLGATATEDAMIDEMVRAYNSERTDYDHEQMKKYGMEKADGTFADPLYDPKSGKFPVQVSKHDILAAKPYTLDGTQRKGGFVAGAGKELDADKVKETRDKE